MEFLVTMTTNVPDGTRDEDVTQIRAREAARARELAGGGHLLRLWRPPLRPGEWRTLGLFAAADAAELESVLASMPLRVWRTDEVTPLGHHPNDPAAPVEGDPAAREYLTTFAVRIPDGTPAATVEDVVTREAHRARELAEQGPLLRMWALPGDLRALGLWQVRDQAQLPAILASLPLSGWMTVDTTPLDQHPNDPALRPPSA